MAIPIKAIPTLYGEEAARLRRKIDEVEERLQVDRNEISQKNRVI